MDHRRLGVNIRRLDLKVKLNPCSEHVLAEHPGKSLSFRSNDFHFEFTFLARITSEAQL